MKNMSIEIILVLNFILAVTLAVHAGTTINYTYDTQHRLTSVDYSDV